jgi:hypothetical protein
MNLRIWWWVGAGLDFILLAPALYMAIGAVEIAFRSQGPAAAAVATLFSALPIFCILAPWAAWRASVRARPVTQIVVLLAAPWVYAIFLVAFLFSA